MIHDNSRRAYNSIQAGLPKKEAMVLNAILSAGANGMTRDEVSAATGILIQTVTGRVLSLVSKKLIIETDRNRNTRTGRAGAVLVATNQLQDAT